MKTQRGVKGNDMAKTVINSQCALELDRKAGLNRQDLVCLCNRHLLVHQFTLLGKKKKKKKTLKLVTLSLKNDPFPLLTHDVLCAKNPLTNRNIACPAAVFDSGTGT